MTCRICEWKYGDLANGVLDWLQTVGLEKVVSSMYYKGQV